MGRLSRGDARWVREASARLASWAPSDADAAGWLVPALHGVAGARGVGCYATTIVDRAPRLEFFHWCDDVVPENQNRRILQTWMAQHRRRWSLFDPSRPSASQRNRVVVLPSSSQVAAQPSLIGPLAGEIPDAFEHAIETLLRPCVTDCPQARIMICDGPRLLAWFGLVDERGFDHRQLALLRAIAGPLRRRLLLEDTLHSSAALELALEATLEMLPAAAFVVSGSRTVLYANAAGRAALEMDRALPSLLCAPGGPDPRRFDVTRLPTDATCHYLVLVRGPAPAMDARVARAARYWGLTPRETEVLHHLARGASNRRIAAELGCALRTVEIHVSRILAKADVESRAALVAKLLGAD